MPISILRIAAQLACAAASPVPSASSTQKTARHCSEAGIAILASPAGHLRYGIGRCQGGRIEPGAATYYSSRPGAKQDFLIMPFRLFAAFAIALDIVFALA